MKAAVRHRQTLLSLFMTLLVGLSAPEAAFGQTEKLGGVSYTPPQGWTKTPKENVVAFSSTYQGTGGFCIITLYGAAPSAGSPSGDFTKEWNNLVVKTLQAAANPQTETELSDGWTATAGGAAVDFQGGKAVAFLTVISGFGKTVSVLAVFNEQAYAAQVQAFIGSIKLEKTPAALPSAGGHVSHRAPPNSAPGKFGPMSYTRPAGWSEQQFQDGVVFKPTDLPAGEHLAVQIMAPLNASGTLEQALRHSYDEAAAMYKATMMNFAGGANYNKTDAQKSFQGWEYIRGKGGVQVENGTPYKTELGLELFVLKVNNRFERVAILESRPSCKTYSSRYYSSDRTSYRGGIETLLFSLRFSDFNPPAAKQGSTDGAGVVGVWQGISLATKANVGIRYDVFTPIFLSNGQAYFGPKFPTEGLDGLDTRIPPELHRRDWGTFSFANGRGVLKMPYADIPLRMEGDKLIITANQTDHAFYRLPSVDGATFNGTYALSEVNGKIPTITFTPGGSFNDGGALKVLYHEYVECLNPAAAPGSGTYEVRDYSVIFTYSDGRRIKLAFLGAEYQRANPSPPTLRMSDNEDKLIRQ